MNAAKGGGPRPSVAEERAAEQDLARQRKAVEQARLRERFGDGTSAAGRSLVLANAVGTALVLVVSVLGIVDYEGLSFVAA